MKENSKCAFVLPVYRNHTYFYGCRKAKKQQQLQWLHSLFENRKKSDWLIGGIAYLFPKVYSEMQVFGQQVAIK
mgnify:CR=1 FL=1